MALTRDERDFLRNVHRALEDRPLEPDDPYHVRIHERLDADDPVLRMQRHIEFHDLESLQLFSGFSGSGKSTELFRLRRTLEDEGCVVLYANAEDYITGTEPLTIADMLMVVAGGFSDTLNEKLEIDLKTVPFWDRLTAWITRSEMRIDAIEGGIEYASPGKDVLGGLKAGVKIKAELKTGSTFRQNLQKYLSSNLVGLQADVKSFFRDGVATIRSQFGMDTRVVFIFDQLERVRGDYRNWQDVIRSVQQVFTVHLDRLRISDVHCVYAVPAWLTFLSPRPKDMTMLPTVHLWTKDRVRTQAAWDVFHDVVRCRLPAERDGKPVDPLPTMFGPDGISLIERLIEASGCHVRDLLQLLRESLYRATGLPIGADVVDRVVAAARREFLPIARDDARLLHQIDQKRAFDLATIDPESIERLSRFCNGHMVIYFENGAAWYDTHPLIRDEVDRIVTEPGDNA